MLRTICIVGLFLFLTPNLSAQTTATITGVIQDGRGAVIAGAKVTVRNVETNQARSAPTDGEGRYAFTELRVGQYEILAEQTGFVAEKRTAVNLTIGQTAVIDLTLKVASGEYKIDVEDTSPLVNTETSELSYLVG